MFNIFKKDKNNKSILLFTEKEKQEEIDKHIVENNKRIIKRKTCDRI